MPTTRRNVTFRLQDRTLKDLKDASERTGYAQTTLLQLTLDECLHNIVKRLERQPDRTTEERKYGEE